MKHQRERENAQTIPGMNSKVRNVNVDKEKIRKGLDRSFYSTSFSTETYSRPAMDHARHV